MSEMSKTSQEEDSFVNNLCNQRKSTNILIDPTVVVDNDCDCDRDCNHDHINTSTDIMTMFQSEELDGLKSELQIPLDRRSSSTISNIAFFLLQSKLQKYFSTSTTHEIIEVAKQCYLREVSKNKLENICHSGDVITCLYFVQNGFVKIKNQEIGESYYGPGSILGIETLSSDETIWKYDVFSVPGNDVCLCCLPIDQIQRYVGRSGKRVINFITTFWESMRLSREARCPSHLTHLHLSILLPYYDDYLSKLHVDSTMDVIHTARMRIYQRNDDIFVQGNDRTYLYIIVNGECALYRKVNIQSSTSMIMMTIDHGSRYYKDDYFLFDGQPYLDEVTNTIDNNNERISSMSVTSYSHGRHIYTLKAMTRVEICVVPLKEIEKCSVLLKSLELLSSAKYSDLILSDDKFIGLYNNKINWEKNRIKIMDEIFAERQSNQLMEKYHINPSNNLSYDSYYAKKPIQNYKFINLIKNSGIRRNTCPLIETKNDSKNKILIDRSSRIRSSIDNKIVSSTTSTTYAISHLSNHLLNRFIYRNCTSKDQTKQATLYKFGPKNERNFIDQEDIRPSTAIETKINKLSSIVLQPTAPKVSFIESKRKSLIQKTRTLTTIL